MNWKKELEELDIDGHSEAHDFTIKVIKNLINDIPDTILDGNFQTLYRGEGTNHLKQELKDKWL